MSAIKFNGEVRVETQKTWGANKDAITVRTQRARITAKLITSGADERWDRATGGDRSRRNVGSSYRARAVAYRLDGTEWVEIERADRGAPAAEEPT